MQSRYYDPVTCRFINADEQIADVGGDIRGYNLYAYCFNNPVNAIDSNGEWPDWVKLAGGVSTAIVGMLAVSAVVTAAACTAPLLAGVTVVAGLAAITFGANEIQEAFTGDNVLKRTVFRGNDNAYYLTEFVVTTAASFGTQSIVSEACFIAGTAILIAKGQIKIEDISPGDFVWATDPETGETALKEVVQTFVKEALELVHITVNKEEIICTNEHPFYSPVKGWTAACDLRAGDVLALINGEYVVVEQVQHELLESPVLVYNFEVADFHTYYVGNSSILVHNYCKQELVAGDKSGWNAKVSVGGETRHPNTPHAHINYKTIKMASVNSVGEIIVGNLDKSGMKFVKKSIAQIAEGIEKWWY